MNFSKAAWLTSVLGVLLVSAWSGGCSSSSGGGSPNSVGNTAPGVCTDSCDKPCGSDNDCNTANGELCCDYSSVGNGAGKVCQAAKSCPTFCGQDTDCQTSMGQACEPVSLSNSSVKVCEQATQAIHQCSSDAQCTGNNEVCCTIYKGGGLCTAANACPKSCSTSSSCDTAQGEICCTSVAAVDPNLNAPGLCLNPQYSPCPKSCTTSSDCASTGDLCCNGVCQKTCPKSCNVDNDCTNQILLQELQLGAPGWPRRVQHRPLVLRNPHIHVPAMPEPGLHVPRVRFRGRHGRLHGHPRLPGLRLVRQRLRLQQLPGLPDGHVGQLHRDRESVRRLRRPADLRRRRWAAPGTRQA